MDSFKKALVESLTLEDIETLRKAKMESMDTKPRIQPSLSYEKQYKAEFKRWFLDNH